MILVEVKNNYNQYVGLSTEDKPTGNIPMYSLFGELDTEDVYYFDGTSWVVMGEASSDIDENFEVFFNFTINDGVITDAPEASAIYEAIENGLYPIARVLSANDYFYMPLIYNTDIELYFESYPFAIDYFEDTWDFQENAIS